jgi:acyl-CoA thioesterase
MSPEEISQLMYSKDWFSQWLGIEIEEVTTGYCQLSMTIRKEMLNGFGIAHGGITYSLADSAFAFASNSKGKKAVSIETSISHTEQLKEGDKLIAIATELTNSNKLARYKVQITTDEGAVVALFNGTVYKTSKDW